MDDLYDKIMKRDSGFFEDLAIDLVKKMISGKDIETPKRVKDKGIDGIIFLDIFRFEKVCLQSKRWNQGTVSSKDVREFVWATSKLFSQDFFPIRLCHKA